VVNAERISETEGKMITGSNPVLTTKKRGSEAVVSTPLIKVTILKKGLD
jgi:hypothetical protein